MRLLAVPNVSEGRDFPVIERLRESLGPGIDLLDQSSDLDHNRTVFTLIGEPGSLVESLVSLARVAAGEIDMGSWRGVHPATGALDVCPVVWLRREDRAQAESVALETARRVGELGIPVFLYGDLATSSDRTERAFFRQGGVDRLGPRMADEGLAPDFGPGNLNPLAGATLITARPPLAAFNVELEVPRPGIAAEIAAEIRESAGGPAGLRAIGTELSTGREQVSMNIHDPAALPLADVVDLVVALATERGATAVGAEVIGLVPAVALEGYDDRLPIRDFDPEFHLIEARLDGAGRGGR